MIDEAQRTRGMTMDYLGIRDHCLSTRERNSDMHEMTEAEWMAAERRDPSKTYVEIAMPSMWRYKMFVLIVALALVCTGGVLKSVYNLHQLVFVAPAHAEFGTNRDRGYDRTDTRSRDSGWEPIRGTDRHNRYETRSPLHALADIFRSMVGIERKRESGARKLDTSRSFGVDKSNHNGTRADPTRGGPRD